MMLATLNLLDLAVLLAAGCSLLAYLCRLDALQWRRHKPLVILMHIAWCVASAAAAQHAWLGDAGLLEVAAVVGALAWIGLSWNTWATRVPEHFDSGPVPIDDQHLRHISGGVNRSDPS